MGFIKKMQQGNDLLSFWPVGSIYLSVNSTNPSNFFGGTWTQIKDKFLLAAGDTYAAGAEGGSATKNLQHDHTTQGHTLTEAELPKITGYIDIKRIRTTGGTNVPNVTGTSGKFSTSDNGVKTNNIGTQQSLTNAPSDRVTLSFGSGSSHSHGNTGEGLSTTQDIMPPYLTVYMWKRIA